MTHQIKVLTVEGSKMEAFVFEPEGKAPFFLNVLPFQSLTQASSFQL